MKPLLAIEGLKVYYPVKGGVLQRPVAWVKAVDDVTLSIDQGDALGLVGESGCGKTTLVNGLLLLEKLTAGRILFDGHDLAQLSKGELRRLRRSVQVVFQDPFWSLNPRWLVRDIVGEPLRVHEHLGREDLVSAVRALLELVGMNGDDIYKYPHEFSGGLRQRIAIARALALKPRLVVLDEPTSAIDVMSQHQILLMLAELKDRLGLTYILVSHDLSVVRYLANKIAVMYLGQLAEWGPVQGVFANPAHPYTQALFSAVPDPKRMGVDALISPAGEVPSALNPPSGCRFHTRCPEAMDVCRRERPAASPVGLGHFVACWLHSDPVPSTEGHLEAVSRLS
jgi:oligopeptide/dipeptide ABC transporter ATP-binding protein